MLKRLFDIICSLSGIILLSPVFVGITIWIVVDAGWPFYYLQTRVGRNNKDFKLFKFRSMRLDADKFGLLTVGGRDPRLTNSGYWIRKFKWDEFPQLFNVLIGDMSLVGPRPEVRKYVDLYNPEQMKVLTVRPGITDYASIRFRNENEILEKVENPEEYYIKTIMPLKLKMNLIYINNRSIFKDINVIFKTIFLINS